MIFFMDIITFYIIISIKIIADALVLYIPLEIFFQ
jgi:hypothetical protein